MNKTRTIDQVKQDLVAAHRVHNWELAKTLSIEKNRLKKIRYCADCGQRIRGDIRCILHANLHRYYGRSLGFRAAATLVIVLCLATISAVASPWGETSVSLAWSNSPSIECTATLIYWGPSSGNYTNFITVPVPSNTCTVSNLIPGKTYFFVAVATDGTQNADPSNEVSTRLKIGRANNLTITGKQ